MILPGIHVAEDFSLNDDLRTDVRTGLEKDGVHIYMGLKASRFGLNHLGSPHFSTLRGNKGIEGHILGLKRGNFKMILPEYPAQTGNDYALAHERAGSLDH
jgi:hypothetical protein